MWGLVYNIIWYSLFVVSCVSCVGVVQCMYGIVCVSDAWCSVRSVSRIVCVLVYVSYSIVRYSVCGNVVR